MAKVSQKPHAVCIPYPAQSHIKAMLKLAQLLHSQNFRITFVNTEYNHRRYLKSVGLDSVIDLPDFRFETIPDGLPVSDSDTTQDVAALSDSLRVNCLGPFLGILERVAPVTCIVSDGFMSFTVQAGEKFGIPVVLFWTIAACALMAFCHFQELREKGFVPLKDATYLTNGYLDTVVDWIPGIGSGIRLKDLPTLIRTTEPNDPMYEFCIEAATGSSKASANIIHTFEELEADVLSSLSLLIPQVYPIGPLQLLLNQVSKKEQLVSISYSLWKEEPLCLKWLDSKKPGSVLYVNFGSIAIFTPEKVMEIALGLANSEQAFLWIIRPDLIVGESEISLADVLEVTKEKGFTTSWCPQEEVLNHSSIGAFLTHCGWNSTIESLSSGVPLICLPFFAEQQTNCWYLCNAWGVGLEIPEDFDRNDVERIVRELVTGETGKKMKKKAMEWKEKAENSVGENGPFFKLINMLKE